MFCAVSNPFTVFLGCIVLAIGPVVVQSVLNRGGSFSSAAVVQVIFADIALSPLAVLVLDKKSEAVRTGCGLVFLCDSLNFVYNFKVFLQSFKHAKLVYWVECFFTNWAHFKPAFFAGKFLFDFRVENCFFAAKTAYHVFLRFFFSVLKYEPVPSFHCISQDFSLHSFLFAAYTVALFYRHLFILNCYLVTVFWTFFVHIAPVVVHNYKIIIFIYFLRANRANFYVTLIFFFRIALYFLNKHLNAFTFLKLNFFL